MRTTHRAPGGAWPAGVAAVLADREASRKSVEAAGDAVGRPRGHQRADLRRHPPRASIVPVGSSTVATLAGTSSRNSIQFRSPISRLEAACCAAAPQAKDRVTHMPCARMAYRLAPAGGPIGQTASPFAA